MINNVSWDVLKEISTLSNQAKKFWEGYDYFHFYETALKVKEISLNYNYSNGLAKANLLLGMLERIKYNFDESDALLEKAFQTAKKLDDSNLLSQILMEKAILYFENGLVENAISFINQSVDLNLFNHLALKFKILITFKDNYQNSLNLIQKYLRFNEIRKADFIEVKMMLILVYKKLSNFDSAMNVLLGIKQYFSFPEFYHFWEDYLNKDKINVNLISELISKTNDIMALKFINFLINVLEVNDNFLVMKIMQKIHALEHHNLNKFYQKLLSSVSEKKQNNVNKVELNIQSENGSIGFFSHQMNQILNMTDFFYKDRSIPVLIEGETGTGKEIIARLIHFGKDENNSPFYPINCASISKTLFESELFGYEKGAFTGADEAGKKGIFELANGGTVFLDEIGELPIELQAKLLRIIQEKEFYRVGGSEKVKTDVRIIAATNRDLIKEIEKGRFRSDLYYRLNTGRIFIPPLKERKDEIIPLSKMFLKELSKKRNKSFQKISPEAEKILKSYDWKGNIRELKNAIERVVLLYDEKEIMPEHLNFLPNRINNNEKKVDSIVIPLPEEGIALEDIQRLIIQKIHNKFGGNKSKTAKYLNTYRLKIYNYLKKE